MKNKLTILLLFVFGLLQAQAPLNFSSRLNVTNITGSDPYTLTGVIQDDLGLWSASDLNASQDSIYHLEGSDLLIYRITSISSASGNNFTIVVDDIMNSGILPSTGNEWAAMAFTTNFQFPMEIGNLATNFKATIDNRFKQRLDAALQAAGGGGATNLAISGTSSPLTLTSSTGTDVTITAGTNVTLAGTSGNVTINSTNPGGDLTEVTATDPLSVTSGTGPIPNVALTGIVPISNGGTGSATQTWWDLTTDQTSLGTKRTSGGLLVGTNAPITGHKFGTTSQHIVAYKGGSAALSAESLWQDLSGEVHEINSQVTSGTTNEHRVVATGDDSTNKGSKFTEYARTAGASKNVVKTMERGVYSADLPYLNIGSAGLSTMFANATYNSALNVPGTGMAVEGTVGYLFTANGGAGGEEFRIVQKNGATYTTTASIDATTNGWNVGSDKKLKHDIETVDVTPELIRKLNTRKFKWNHSDKEDLGVIAQDFLDDDVLKLILRGNEKEGLKVNPLGVAALALGAAKTLQQQVDELNATIVILLNRIEKLENKK